MKTQLSLSKGIPTHLFMAKQITSLHQLPLANIPHCLTRVCCVPSILPALPLAEKAADMPVPWVVCPEFFHYLQKLKSIRTVLWKYEGWNPVPSILLIQMLTTVASRSFWMLATVITVCRRLHSSPKTTLLIIYRLQDHELFPVLHHLPLFFMRLVAILSDTSASTLTSKE